MKRIAQLRLELHGEQKVILFGIPDTLSELDDMFSLRFKVYEKRGYIEADKKRTDRDEYDENGRSTYFVASVENRIIGSVRLIQDGTLPTEKAFNFSEPKDLRNISSQKRFELGRLVIQAYNHEEERYLPRNIILLFLIYCLSLYASDNGLEAGYAFIKEKLLIRIKQLHIPVKIIGDYTQTYPEGGILHNYFNQPDNKVVPIYFLANDIRSHIDHIIHKKNMFAQEGKDSFILKNNLYNRFLRNLKIL